MRVSKPDGRPADGGFQCERLSVRKHTVNSISQYLLGEGSVKVRAGKKPGRPYADLWSRPGFLVRRMHQIHVGLFLEECRDYEITPIQFAILTVLYSGNALDQITLSNSVGVDRTSGADVIRRLYRRGLVERVPSREDRRAMLVHITDEGKAFVRRMQPHMERAQERFISPLTAAEQTLFIGLIEKVVRANNDASRAPTPLGF
jgi:MarR family transcriptional regulator, lower aerobic nicotinate degradation pathway regulator